MSIRFYTLNGIFQENLRLLLAERALTQTQLAVQLNTTQATVSRWLKGNFLPNIRVQTLLAQFFGVRGDWLLRGEGPKQDESIYANILQAKARAAERSEKQGSTSNPAGPAPQHPSDRLNQMREYLHLFVRDFNDPQIIAKAHELLDYRELAIHERVVLVQELLSELSRRHPEQPVQSSA